MNTDPINSTPNLGGATPDATASGVGGGSKGDATSSPSPAVSGVPGNVAGPLSGDHPPGDTGGTGMETLAVSVPKKSRKPRSDKRKLKLSFSPGMTKRITDIPPGERSRTVEMAVMIFLDGFTPEGLDKALPELCNLSIRVQQLLRILVRSKSINPADLARVEGYGAAVILQISRLLRP